MSRLDCPDYLQDVASVAGLNLPWDLLQGKTLLISGATGMIGCFFIDVLLYRNLNCTVIALTRNVTKALERATPEWNKNVQFVACDINRSIPEMPGRIDYIIHAASNTHPVAYAKDPIGTIATNIIGTQHILEVASACHAKRTIFLSTVEIYGQNRGDCERFDERYCGYIDCNTLRAGYPEGKRAGEALCQAYIRQKDLDIVIPRLPRIYGPTMLQTDTKAVSQFLKNGVNGENIVLKSKGDQLFSYCYVSDAVAGILYCLFRGQCAEAYNIGDPASDITLKELAGLIAANAGKTVVFDLPEETERIGYSKATKALMDGTKLRALGWTMQYNIRSGVERTMRILKALSLEKK